MKLIHFKFGNEIIEAEYRIDGDELLMRRLDTDRTLRFKVEDVGGELMFESEEGRSRISARRDGERVHVSKLGEPFIVRRFVPDPASAGQDSAAVDLEAPMTGKVVKVLVEAGAEIAAGDAVVIVEAMKMEHKLTAPFDATVESIHAVEGQQVDMNEKLAHLVRRDEGEGASD